MLIVCSESLVIKEFSLNKKVSLKELSHLEELKGIAILSKLKENSAFQFIIQVHKPDTEAAIEQWVKNSAESKIKPTWKNLLLILHLLDLDHVAQQIEAYFGVTIVLAEQQPRTIAPSMATSKETHVAVLNVYGFWYIYIYICH